MSTVKKLCPLLCVLFAISGCFGSDSDDKQYQIELRTSDDIVFTNAKVQIRLFGYDQSLADAGATDISTELFNLNGMPATFKLSWPSNAADLIEPAIREDRKDNARFYFSVRVDVDGDGLLCQGDLRRDYNLSPLERLERKPATTTVISMTENDADFCSAFSSLVPVML